MPQVRNVAPVMALALGWTHWRAALDTFPFLRSVSHCRQKHAHRLKECGHTFDHPPDHKTQHASIVVHGVCRYQPTHVNSISLYRWCRYFEDTDKVRLDVNLRAYIADCECINPGKAKAPQATFNV